MLLPWATLAAEQRQIPRVAFATSVLKRVAATDAPQIDHFNDYGKPSSHAKLSPVEIPLNAPVYRLAIFPLTFSH